MDNSLTQTGHRVPPATGMVGMILFLLSLTMLFAAAIVGYALIRITGRLSPPPGSIHVPALLWASTIVVLVSSVTIQHALVCLRYERQKHFRLSLTSTLGLALLFIAIQTPALIQLLANHRQVRTQNIHLYGLMFFLILLHALHVIGGLIPLIIAFFKARRGGYDHENYRPIQYLAMYWHFLDVVWVVLFIALLILA